MTSAGSCTSCPDGHVLKKGKCERVDCAFAQGLGVCLESLSEGNSRRWLASLVVPLLLLAVGGGWWMYIRRQRAKRRAEVKQFGDAMDQVRARSGEDNDTVGMRLERILGLNRIRLASADDLESRKQNSRLKDLLLPLARKDDQHQSQRSCSNEIPLAGKTNPKSEEVGSRASASRYFVPPPPPYRQSTSTISTLDLPQRGETRLIPAEKISSLSSPSPRTSSFPVIPPATSSASASAFGSGPKPPPRHKAPADEMSRKPLVRFSGVGGGSESQGLDELWPARKVEGWV